MKRGYTIKCYKNTSLGFIIETLNIHSDWCVATNEGSFKTLSEARAFFKTSIHALRGLSIWIEGPKGGKHSLFERLDIDSILIALNSTNDLGFKYPIGNKELCIKVRQLESDGIIQYSPVFSKWVKKNDRSIK